MCIDCKYKKFVRELERVHPGVEDELIKHGIEAAVDLCL